MSVNEFQNYSMKYNLIPGDVMKLKNMNKFPKHGNLAISIIKGINMQN